VVLAVRDGSTVSIAAAPVGDRVQLHKLWLEHGQIRMEVVEAGPGEPACCPTQLSRKTFALEGGVLQQTSSIVRGVLSVQLLAAADWVLASMDGEPMAPSHRPPTLLVPAGQVVGFGGCNRFSGPLTESAPGKLSIGPLATTRMACPVAAMELEAKFIARLVKVTGYGFQAGQLALTWADERSGGQLLFAR